jgi:hypothetical protein
VLREAISWGDTQLRMHLERLLELEYLLAHREGPGGKFVYELVYEVAGQKSKSGGVGRAQFAGLLDVATLHDVPTVAKSRPQTPKGAGQLRGDSGPVAAHSRGSELAAEPITMGLAADLPGVDSEMHCSGLHASNPSYTQALSLAA